MAEWFKAPVLKTGVGSRSPWVRIHPIRQCRYRRTIEALQQLPVKSAYARWARAYAPSTPTECSVFSRLQAAMEKAAPISSSSMPSNSLFLDGRSTAHLPLVERRARACSAWA